MAIKEVLPWYAKVAAKLVLARAPVGYSFWRRVALFRHGKMDQPSYAYRVFMAHCERVLGAPPPRDFTVLELGPGDSLCTALVASAVSAKQTYLVDVGNFAVPDLELYHRMAHFLRDQDLPVPDLQAIDSLEGLLAASRARYLTTGLESLRCIPDESVDFVFSHAVLEHVRRPYFLETMREVRRILRPGGGCSHNVDLRDHLGGALNHLRFSEPVWESEFMASSGFYTNRIRYHEMLRLFAEAGFTAEAVLPQSWVSLPTPRKKMAAEFRGLEEDNLRVSAFDIVLRPA